MLVLARKRGESVRIGNAIVYVSRIKDGSVRLAIEAPQEVKILRSELEAKDANETDGSTGKDASFE